MRNFRCMEVVFTKTKKETKCLIEKSFFVERLQLQGGFTVYRKYRIQQYANEISNIINGNGKEDNRTRTKHMHAMNII